MLVKRTLILTALFILLAVAAWLAIRFQKKNAAGSANSWDMEFAVKDPAQVYKIFFADKKGNTTTLERREGYWLYNGKYRARQTGVELILNTVSHLNVLFVPTHAAVPNMVKSLAAEGIKVELYDKNNNKIKTIYVGGVTQDERGTYAMLEGSNQPYVVHIPSMVGSIRPHFTFGDHNWRDKSVFQEKPEEITTISVEYPQQRNESFKIVKVSDATYAVQPFYSTTQPNPRPQRKGLAEGYLLMYESLGAEAFESENPLRDSVLNLVPFAVVTVENKTGIKKQARFWPVETLYQPANNEPYIYHYFTDVNGQDFMLTQHHVFGKIFRGYSSFFEGSGKVPVPY